MSSEDSKLNIVIDEKYPFFFLTLVYLVKIFSFLKIVVEDRDDVIFTCQIFKFSFVSKQKSKSNKSGDIAMKSCNRLSKFLLLSNDGILTE